MKNISRSSSKKTDTIEYIFLFLFLTSSLANSIQFNTIKPLVWLNTPYYVEQEVIIYDINIAYINPCKSWWDPKLEVMSPIVYPNQQFPQPIQLAPQQPPPDLNPPHLPPGPLHHIPQPITLIDPHEQIRRRSTELPQRKSDIEEHKVEGTEASTMRDSISNIILVPTKTTQSPSRQKRQAQAGIVYCNELFGKWDKALETIDDRDTGEYGTYNFRK